MILIIDYDDDGGMIETEKEKSIEELQVIEDKINKIVLDNVKKYWR